MRKISGSRQRPARRTAAAPAPPAAGPASPPSSRRYPAVSRPPEAPSAWGAHPETGNSSVTPGNDRRSAPGAPAGTRLRTRRESSHTSPARNGANWPRTLKNGLPLRATAPARGPPMVRLPPPVRPRHAPLPAGRREHRREGRMRRHQGVSGIKENRIQIQMDFLLGGCYNGTRQQEVMTNMDIHSRGGRGG
jgi:hypothetical protein